MKKIYHLSTCDTCKRILKRLDPGPGVELQDIKKAPLDEASVDALRHLAGSYQALFSKRAQLYKQRGLGNQVLEEADFRALLLEHYTFLKRPVIVIGEAIFIGNAEKTIAAAEEALKH